ncbi:MAG: transporter substrate-binding domain-containing protein [Desulfobacteraceae bacterium]|nr:transporter substrate-binding domain-containing protein [Desulfobacteraceae bacterium]
MKTILFYFVVSLCVLMTNISGADEKITIFTEEFPPFQFMENGKIVGASVDIVKAIMKKANVPYEIKTYPWARTYNNVQKEPNSLIFSISRRPAREGLFKWLGIIVPSRYSVFTLKGRSEVKVTALEEMKNYKIGTTIEDARESYLVSQGFKLSDFDRSAGDNANIVSYKKLKVKRIDLWPMPDAVAFYISKSQGDDPTTVLHRPQSTT